jgi:hypothetical protein
MDVYYSVVAGNVSNEQLLVITGHSRSQNGVLPLAYVPVICVLLSFREDKDVDGRVKPGHDEGKMNAPSE